MLLDAVADALYADIDLPSPGGEWWTALERLAHSTRHVLLAHAWSVPLLSRPLRSEHSDALGDALRQTLRSAGFPVLRAGLEARLAQARPGASRIR